jgi:hypothetical protein
VHTDLVARVDPDDDELVRYIVRRYAYDPSRHERCHQTIAAFDNAAEFEQYIRAASSEPKSRRDAGEMVDVREHFSGVVKSAGDDERQRQRRIAWRAISHGASPPADAIQRLGDEIVTFRRSDKP